MFFAPVTLAQEATPPPMATQPAGAAPGGTGAPGGAPQQAPGGAPGSSFLLILLLVFGFMILLQIFSGRKQKKQRKAMLSSITKHDRVQTVGGIIGTVAEIRDDEIVLKVDEATNTKIRFARSAVQQVVRKAGARSESSQVEEPEMVNA